MRKPRIKLVNRQPVFQAKQWRCSGFDSRTEYYGLGYGWTPQEAYYNWKSNVSTYY